MLKMGVKVIICSCILRDWLRYIYDVQAGKLKSKIPGYAKHKQEHVLAIVVKDNLLGIQKSESLAVVQLLQKSLETFFLYSTLFSGVAIN